MPQKVSTSEVRRNALWVPVMARVSGSMVPSTMILLSMSMLIVWAAADRPDRSSTRLMLAPTGGLARMVQSGAPVVERLSWITPNVVIPMLMSHWGQLADQPLPALRVTTVGSKVYRRWSGHTSSDAQVRALPPDRRWNTWGGVEGRARNNSWTGEA